MSRPVLSVILPCYNAEDTLHEQLQALATQECRGGWELILVDNGSTDDSVRIANTYRDSLPEFQIVDARERQGAAYAMNVGWRTARSPMVSFCDADDVADTGWVGAISRALHAYPFVASRFEYERLNTARELATRGPAQVSSLQHGWYPPYLPHAGACGLGVRKEVLEAVDGFDEERVLLDTDFCIRVGRRGIDLHFVEDAVMHIRLRTETGEIFRQARLWARDNVFLYKEYGAPEDRVVHPWIRHLMEWERVLRRMKWIGNVSGRAHLVWKAGWLLGQLEGAIRYHSTPVPFYRSTTSESGAA